MGIRIGAHIVKIGQMDGKYFDPVDPEFDKVGHIFPALSAEKAEQMQENITMAKENGDSIGGTIECAITGLPAGIGEPMFGGVESKISQIVYGIPAVKSITFGNTADLGSENNDGFVCKNGVLGTLTNHCGGILGGITNGMPVIFSVSIKPTPSIAKAQQTVNMKTGEITMLEIKGRHDPCIVPRAVPVVEAAAAIAIYDLILGNTQASRRK